MAGLKKSEAREMEGSRSQLETLEIPESLRGRLVCPICKEPLSFDQNQLACSQGGCGATFPVIDGVPVLINDVVSVFAVSDFVDRRRTTFSLKEGWIKKAARRYWPSITNNIKGKRNNQKLAELLTADFPSPRILIIGSGPGGVDPIECARIPGAEVVATDVSFGRGVVLICDAHDIPFADETFDAVVLLAVLEHVADPHRCADEIHRVLCPRGLVHADTAFVQQVHGREYDFERFTHLGHRRLFRRFDEIESGASAGPGMALAWAYYYFLLSFFRNKTLRQVIWAFAGMTSFFLKYFDYYLIDRSPALDAASACYFIGRKSAETLSDRDLVGLYRGSI